MTKIYHITAGAALCIAFLFTSAASSEALRSGYATPDSLHIVQHQKKIVDSIFRNLPCLKGQDDGITVLYKDKRISHKGRFTNWKLMCGLLYVYDNSGHISTVKVYEQGIFTREVPIPKH